MGVHRRHSPEPDFSGTTVLVIGAGGGIGSVDGAQILLL